MRSANRKLYKEKNRKDRKDWKGWRRKEWIDLIDLNLNHTTCIILPKKHRKGLTKRDNNCQNNLGKFHSKSIRKSMNFADKMSPLQTAPHWKKDNRFQLKLSLQLPETRPKTTIQVWSSQLIEKLWPHVITSTTLVMEAFLLEEVSGSTDIQRFTLGPLTLNAFSCSLQEPF